MEQEDPDIREIIGDQEVRNLLNQMLNDLGNSCRKVLELFYFEDLPMKDIVSHLHYENEQVVRNKKYKCLQQLTEKMKQNPLAEKLIKELIRN